MVRTRSTRAAVAIAALALVLHAPAALGDPPPEQREADVLFQEGKALMEQGAVSEACAKFAQSLDRMRRGGVLLNLAVCREKEGRTATAFQLFQDALGMAIADGRAEREEVARTRIEQLRTKLSWLEIAPAPGADVPGFTITRDGAPVPRAAWSTITPVDPGRHTITAAAPGRERFETTITVGDAGDRKRVEIPVLAAPPAPTASPSASATAPPAPSAGGNWRKPAGITALGVGVASMSVGAVFGVKAIMDSNESKRLCPDRQCTTDEGLAKNASARTAAKAANVLLPIGVLAAGAGIFFLLTQPRARTEPPKKAALRFTPSAGSEGASVTLEGAW